MDSQDPDVITDVLITALDTDVRDRMTQLYEDNPDASFAELRGAYLKLLFEHHRLTVLDAAASTGYTSNMLYRIMRGEKPMSLKFIRAISDDTPLSRGELVAMIAVTNMMEISNE